MRREMYETDIEVDIAGRPAILVVGREAGIAEMWGKDDWGVFHRAPQFPRQHGNRNVGCSIVHSLIHGAVSVDGEMGLWGRQGPISYQVTRTVGTVEYADPSPFGGHELIEK